MSRNAVGDSGVPSHWRQQPGWEKPRPEIVTGMIVYDTRSNSYLLITRIGERSAYYIEVNVTTRQAVSGAEEEGPEPIRDLQSGIEDGDYIVIR